MRSIQKADKKVALYADAKPGFNTLVERECLDGPLGDTTWSNVNWFLAETLRSQYEVNNIVRLECRALPDTEDEYSYTASILVKNPGQLHPQRQTRKGPKRSTGHN
jgi:hypothetical protein